VSFDVAGDVYGRFMGRYSEPLAVPFAAFAGVAAGQRVLDVGCGPGALTAHLGSITEPRLVAAVDPSPPFVAAAAARCPGSTVQLGTAESLPYPDASFDVALAELVVHFMKDPVVGLREMARVTKPHGIVAACVWDGSTGALGPFWDAVHEIDPETEDEAALAGARRGHLAELFDAAGLGAIESEPLTVDVIHPSFDEWWEPYTLGVGPAGDYVARLDHNGRQRLEETARARLPDGPFTVSATAWAARGMRTPSP
jgi:SAM-dependent methyltransferase